MGGRDPTACSVGNNQCPPFPHKPTFGNTVVSGSKQTLEAEFFSDGDAFCNLYNGRCIFKEFFKRKKKIAGNGYIVNYIPFFCRGSRQEHVCLKEKKKK